MSPPGDCGGSESEGKGRLKRHGAERFYAFFVALRALQINGSRLLLRRGAGKLCTRNARARQRYTSRPVEPLAALVLLRTYSTSAALGNFQARTHHDECPRIPPFVDNSSSTPRSPVRGRGVRGASRGRRVATGTRASPNENRLVAPRAALGRLSCWRSRRRTWGDESTQAHASLQRPATSLRHREEL